MPVPPRLWVDERRRARAGGAWRAALDLPAPRPPLGTEAVVLENSGRAGVDMTRHASHEEYFHYQPLHFPL